ncbi:DUF3533 domain-containing protein [Streptomyces luteolifulvus]|jgi:hypothetical protein|uniref:DUF3533 domain-containing protein n=1 Tax=Streptomyces luteolifulvus TaxID=2615112 RepID=A0A6H9V865_9ACTN|nr:DUF3533 domain-containing protein [Streptomyces luteolifulvus]KAB1150483.1 DUF3533 domain-containing protein [Streptomyces luteolifulvus]
MTQPPADGTRRDSLLAEVKDAVTLRATLLVTGVVTLQLLFIASYMGALHNPKPRDVPFGVVAPRAAAEQAVDQLERLPGDPLDPRTVADAATARNQITDRDIDGALIIDPAATTDTLLVASGGGRALSNTLITLTTALERPQGRAVRTVDVAPSGTKDPSGLSSFYLVVGWCVGGYLCAAALAMSAGAQPSDPQRAVIRLAVMALVAIVGGLGGAVIAGPVLDALPGSTAALWGLGALIVFAVGAATLAFQGLFGTIGVGLAILLVVILGNPSAGGALPLPLLPPFWQAIGPALPPGTGTWTARSIAYFDGNDVAVSLLVLSAWALAGVVITLLAAALRRKQRPARDPSAPPARPTD